MNSKTSNEVYPRYTFHNGIYRSYIRKLHNGVWYLFLLKCHSTDINYFLKQAYLCILFGQVETELKDINGNDIYQADENQETEQERLLPSFLTNKP
jgi:hypothetical protein